MKKIVDGGAAMWLAIVRVFLPCYRREHDLKELGIVIGRKDTVKVFICRRCLRKKEVPFQFKHG